MQEEVTATSVSSCARASFFCNAEAARSCRCASANIPRARAGPRHCRDAARSARSSRLDPGRRDRSARPRRSVPARSGAPRGRAAAGASRPRARCTRGCRHGGRSCANVRWQPGGCPGGTAVSVKHPLGDPEDVVRHVVEEPPGWRNAAETFIEEPQLLFGLPEVLECGTGQGRQRLIHRSAHMAISGSLESLQSCAVPEPFNAAPL
jgi:hypothetical protein